MASVVLYSVSGMGRPKSMKLISPRVILFRNRMGARIYFLRTLHGLTAREMLKRMGRAHSHSNFSAMENGDRMPSLGYCERMAEALDIPLRDIFTEQHPDTTLRDPFDQELIPLIRTLTPEQKSTFIETLRDMSRKVTDSDNK